MITEKLKRKILKALDDKRVLVIAKEESVKAQTALSMANYVWERTQIELSNELEATDKNMGNRVFSIDGKTYLVISGYGNPKNVDVQEIQLEEYTEPKPRTIRDSIA